MIGRVVDATPLTGTASPGVDPQCGFAQLRPEDRISHIYEYVLESLWCHAARLSSCSIRLFLRPSSKRRDTVDGRAPMLSAT